MLFLSAVADFRGGAERVLLDLAGNPEIEPCFALPRPGPIATFAAERGMPVRYYRPGASEAVHRPLRPGPMLAAAADVVRCAARLRGIARGLGADLIHSNNLKTHVLVAAARRLPGLPPSVVHLHDIAYTGLERLTWRALVAAGDRIVGVSPPCWPTTAPPARFEVIPNGVEVRPPPPPRRPARPLRLGFVGRYHHHKCLDVAVEWYAAARAAGIPCELVFRGAPDPVDPSHWRAVERQLRSQGLSYRDEGWQDADKVFDGLDVVVQSSRLPEPLSRVVMEAISFGVPVIAYPSGGIPVMIRDGESGFLVDRPEAFVAALRRLADDPDTYEAIRRQAYRVSTEFTVARFHARINQLYADLLASRRPSAEGAPLRRAGAIGDSTTPTT